MKHFKDNQQKNIYILSAYLIRIDTKCNLYSIVRYKKVRVCDAV